MSAIESTADQTRAFLLAVGVHLLAGFVMFSGLLFSPEPQVVVPRGVIDAVFVDMTVGRPPPKPTAKPEPRKPEPEPTPKRVEPEPVAPPPVVKPDDVTDNKPILPVVPDQEALNFERKREELRKQQEEARRQQELEEQRIQQLADIRKQRAAAEAERERAERLLADVQDQRVDDSPPPAEPQPVGEQRVGADVEDSLLGQYVGLIQQVVTQNWRRPANTPVGIRCKLRVRQIPGGDVIGVEIGSPCNADPLIQESIKNAVERASPLPYEGFDSVFQSAITFNFEYDG